VLDAVMEANDTCFACGQPVSQCACAGVRQRLQLQAEALTMAGYEAIQERELHRAKRVFGQALSIDVTIPRAWIGLGLSSLALGEPAQALAAFSTANEQSRLPTLDIWIFSLTSGDLNRNLLAYKNAVQFAKAGKWSDALQEIGAVLAEFPDFIPAGRLKGLVLAGAGRIADARLAWEAALTRCTDDSILRDYLGDSNGGLAAHSESKKTPTFLARTRQLAIGVVAGTVLTFSVLHIGSTGQGVKPERPLVATAGSPDSAPHNPRWTSPASVLGIALDDEEDSVAALVRSIGDDTVQWSPSARRRGRALVQNAGWHHYRSGLKAARRANLRLAVAELERAVELGFGAFYHDDALYNLAILCRQTGKQSEAQETARLLLERYPGSPFANSITRRLARTTWRD
jgi:tetratricopeptide (TPR) repeat protein